MFNTAINTIRPCHHVWSLSNEFGVLREGVAKSLTEAMREIRKAKKEAKLCLCNEGALPILTAQLINAEKPKHSTIINSNVILRNKPF